MVAPFRAKCRIGREGLKHSRLNLPSLPCMLIAHFKFSMRGSMANYFIIFPQIIPSCSRRNELWGFKNCTYYRMPQEKPLEKAPFIAKPIDILPYSARLSIRNDKCEIVSVGCVWRSEICFTRLYLF